MNPSAVPHYDQSGMPKGSLRILMSLRAVGEDPPAAAVIAAEVAEQLAATNEAESPGLADAEANGAKNVTLIISTDSAPPRSM